MQKKYRFPTAVTLRSIGLGTLCAIGAFAMGIETAGDVHPFARSEAALQEIVHAGSAIRGDVNGNGMLDPEDAYILHEAAEGLLSPTAAEIRLGDTDGDWSLTEKDVGYVLHVLSTR